MNEVEKSLLNVKKKKINMIQFKSTRDLTSSLLVPLLDIIWLVILSRVLQDGTMAH